MAFWMTTNLFATGCGLFLRLCRPRPAVSPREQPPLRAALGAGKNVFFWYTLSEGTFNVLRNLLSSGEKESLHCPTV